MDVGAETFTDARGRFRFTGLPQGRPLFAILTADCRIAWSEIFAIEGIPRETKLRLPQAFGAVAEPAVLWRGGSARLLDYGGAGRPVLFVPSLVNRAYILDLAPGRSLVRHLAARGRRPPPANVSVGCTTRTVAAGRALSAG